MNLLRLLGEIGRGMILYELVFYMCCVTTAVVPDVTCIPLAPTVINGYHTEMAAHQVCAIYLLLLPRKT